MRSDMKATRVHCFAILCAAALSARLAAPTCARGDVVNLRKGGSITGVIVSENEKSVEIRSNLGTIIFSRGAISEIRKASAEENAGLESQWKKDKAEREQRIKEARRFEEEQRAKGLVKTDAGWVPAEKAAEAEKAAARDREREELEKAIEVQKRDLQEMERRMKELEARLEQRQRDLELREQQLALREQNLLLQQQNLQRQAEQISQGRQDRPPKLFAIPRIEVYPPTP